MRSFARCTPEDLMGFTEICSLFGSSRANNCSFILSGLYHIYTELNTSQPLISFMDLHLGKPPSPVLDSTTSKHPNSTDGITSAQELTVGHDYASDDDATIQEDDKGNNVPAPHQTLGFSPPRLPLHQESKDCGDCQSQGQVAKMLTVDRP